jgi:hypothetical protein
MVLFIEANAPSIIPRVLRVTREILADISNCPASLPMNNIADPDIQAEINVPELNTLLRLYSRLQSHLAILQSIYTQPSNSPGRHTVAYTIPFNQPENVEMLGLIGNVVRYVIQTSVTNLK